MDGSCVEKLVNHQLLSQRPAINTENISGLTLVAARILHDRLEKRFLDFPHNELVEIRRPMPVQAREIAAKGIIGECAQRLISRSRRQRRRRRSFLFLLSGRFFGAKCSSNI